MIVYAESSAVLSWLFGEGKGRTIRSILRKSTIVIASDLTLIECDRVLIRRLVLGEISATQEASRRARLNAAAAHWSLLRISPEIVARARRSFPVEPVRTLDALHLASAMLAATAADDFALLSLDDRIRKNAEQLGLSVSPNKRSPTKQ